MRAFLLCVLVASALPARAEDDPWRWRRSDTVLQVAYTALHLVDWSQTLDIARRTPGEHLWEEGNWYLGASPSRDKVNAYMAATLLIHAGVAIALPRPYRNVWQCLTIGVEAGSVGRNWSAGVNLSF